MDFIDFDLEGHRERKLYGGNAGKKVSYIARGDLWMVKFPQSTRGLVNRNGLPSYTSSPLSEYLGSHIYSTLGIPVHETVLGKLEGRLVVGCRDFGGAGNLVEFSKIKNSVSEELIAGSYGSSSRGERLDDALTVIDRAEAFDGIREEALERFWDMFVVDALILNGDRNNGNWGILDRLYGATSLAPVFDNGNSFFNKRPSPKIERRMLDDNLILQDLDTATSFFLDADDRHIHPFRLMAGHAYEGLDAALGRLAARIDVEAIVGVVNEVPEELAGLEVMSSARRTFYELLLRGAIGRRILPCRPASPPRRADAARRRRVL